MSVTHVEAPTNALQSIQLLTTADMTLHEPCCARQTHVMVELMRKLSKSAAQGTSSGTQNTLHRWTYQRHPPHQAWFQASPGRKWPAIKFDKLRLMSKCSQDSRKKNMEHAWKTMRPMRPKPLMPTLVASVLVKTISQQNTNIRNKYQYHTRTEYKKLCIFSKPLCGQCQRSRHNAS